MRASARHTVRMNKGDLYRREEGLLALLRIESVTEMILMVCASVCVRACASVSFGVSAPGCFADQMQLLFNSPSQQAAPTKCTCASTQARIQTHGAGDEYGDEDETSLQIFGRRGWRWSHRRGAGRGGAPSPWQIAEDWAHVRLCTQGLCTCWTAAHADV